jgi:hypothetical protein
MEMRRPILDLVNVMVDGMNDHGYRLWLFITLSNTRLYEYTTSISRAHEIVSNNLVNSTCMRFTSSRESIPPVDLYQNFLTNCCLLRTFVGVYGKAQWLKVRCDSKMLDAALPTIFGASCVVIVIVIGIMFAPTFNVPSGILTSYTSPSPRHVPRVGPRESIFAGAAGPAALYLLIFA